MTLVRGPLAPGGPYMNLPASPSDGQLASYNAATKLWVPTSPTGNGELAYAENVTGTTQTIGTTATDITACSIAPVASSRPVYLGGTVTVQGGTVPTGLGVFLNLPEVSNGVDTPIAWAAIGFPFTASSGYETINILPRRLASSTARTRNFKLTLQTGSAGTAILQNAATYPSFIVAETR